MGALTVTTAAELEAGGTINSRLFDKWLAFIDAKPKTIQTYTRSIKQFVLYLLENGITEPSREDVLEYRDELKESRKPSTVQAYITAVKLFFTWTAQQGIYPNIAANIKGAKLDRSFKKDYLTSRQAARLLEKVERDTLKGKRDYALLALMLTTGLRTIEVARADIMDLTTAADDTVLYVQGKGRDGKTEYVKIEPHAEEALQDYLAARGPADGAEPLLASIAHRNGGQRMTTRSISRIVKERLKRANLISNRLTAHSLRHTAATLNLLNGGTPQETMQLLRHKDISITMIYSHNLERAKNNSEKRIGKAIFGK